MIGGLRQMKEYLIVFTPSDGEERCVIMPSTGKMILWFLRHIRRCKKIVILGGVTRGGK